MHFVFCLFVFFFCSVSYSVESHATKKQSDPKSIKRQLLDFKPAQAPWLKKHPTVQQEVERIIETTKKSIMEDAKELFKEFPRSVLLPYKLHIRELRLLEHNNQDVVSVRMAVYTYTGGAHGGTRYYSWNWNKQKEKFLSLEEVITPKQFTNLITQVRSILFERQKQNDEYDKHRRAHIERGTSEKKDFKIWSFKKDGIEIIFPEYQVASYAAGIFEVFVPLSSL